MTNKEWDFELSRNKSEAKTFKRKQLERFYVCAMMNWAQTQEDRDFWINKYWQLRAQLKTANKRQSRSSKKESTKLAK